MDVTEKSGRKHEETSLSQFVEQNISFELIDWSLFKDYFIEAEKLLIDFYHLKRKKRVLSFFLPKKGSLSHYSHLLTDVPFGNFLFRELFLVFNYSPLKTLKKLFFSSRKNTSESIEQLDLNSPHPTFNNFTIAEISQRFVVWLVECFTKRNDPVFAKLIEDAYKEIHNKPFKYFPFLLEVALSKKIGTLSSHSFVEDCSLLYDLFGIDSSQLELALRSFPLALKENITFFLLNLIRSYFESDSWISVDMFREVIFLLLSLDYPSLGNLVEEILIRLYCFGRRSDRFNLLDLFSSKNFSLFSPKEDALLFLYVFLFDPVKKIGDIAYSILRRETQICSSSREECQKEVLKKYAHLIQQIIKEDYPSDEMNSEWTRARPLL